MTDLTKFRQYKEIADQLQVSRQSLKMNWVGRDPKMNFAGATIKEKPCL